jgi:hypothetical protein
MCRVESVDIHWVDDDRGEVGDRASQVSLGFGKEGASAMIRCVLSTHGRDSMIAVIIPVRPRQFLLRALPSYKFRMNGAECGQMTGFGRKLIIRLLATLATLILPCISSDTLTQYYLVPTFLLFSPFCERFSQVDSFWKDFKK